MPPSLDKSSAIQENSLLLPRNLLWTSASLGQVATLDSEVSHWIEE